MRTHTTRDRRTRAIRTAALIGAAALTATAATTGSTTTAQADGTPTQLVRAKIVANGGLRGHDAPSYYAPSAHTYPNGTRVYVNCATRGTAIEGNRTWYLLGVEGDDAWVSGRYVKVSGKPRECGPGKAWPNTVHITTKARKGPTTQDKPGRTHYAEGEADVSCYVDTSASGTSRRWLLTSDNEWLPMASVGVDWELEYCFGG